MSELTLQSAVAMAEQIRKKKLSPVELVDAHLARIEKLNPKLNAFVQVDADGHVAKLALPKMRCSVEKGLDRCTAFR